jgi:hypothetical protein
LCLLPQTFADRYDVLAVLVIPPASASAFFDIIWIESSADELDQNLRQMVRTVSSLGVIVSQAQ